MPVTMSVEQKGLLALLKAAGRIRRQIGGALEDCGLSASQYNVLRILRGAKGELPIMSIRDRMMDPEPSITRLVDRLQEKGLTERHRSPGDRRCVVCRLTDKGLSLVDALDGPVDALDRELMKGLSEPELQTLTRLLERVGRTGA